MKKSPPPFSRQFRFVLASVSVLASTSVSVLVSASVSVLASVSVIALALLNGCTKKTTADRITLSGAFALYPMVVKWTEEYQKIHPDIKFDISAGGAGKGMADALNGAADLGMVSRAVNPTEIAKGAWPVSVVKDAVVPTIHAANAFASQLLARGLKKEEFADIWITNKFKDWETILEIQTKSPTHQIRVFTRSDACGAAETWAKYLGKAQENLQGVAVFGDPGLVEAVKNEVNGIGYNNLGFLYDAKTKKPVAGILPLPIDINGNGKLDADENFYGTLDELTQAIATGKYPSPPARELYLVLKASPASAGQANGQANGHQAGHQNSHQNNQRKAVTEFILWTLTEGQKYVNEAGYIALSPARLAEEIKRVSENQK